MQLAAKGLARPRRRRRPDERVEHPFLGRKLGLGFDILALAALHQPDGDLDEVADDLLDVPTDIADLGELGRLDLEEGRAGELGEPAGDHGLAAAGRSDDQDVLRHHFFAHRRGEPEVAASGCVAQWRRALRLRLPDNIAVEFGDDSRGLRSDMNSEAFDDQVGVGVDADVGWIRIERRTISPPRAPSASAPGRRRSRNSARSDRHRRAILADLGLEHVAEARDRESGALVGDQEHRLEAAETAVGAPILRQLDAGAASWPGYCSSFASRRSNRVKASAVAPAKPAITRPSLVAGPCGRSP